MKTRSVPDNYSTVSKQLEEDRERVRELMEEPEEPEESEGPKRVAPIQLEVARQYRVSGKDVGPPEQESEVVLVEGFHVEPAEVSLERGLTMNLDNYESARFSVSIRVPCYREEVVEAYDFAKSFVEERLSKEREGIRKWVKARHGSSDPY